jgi:hypothetical protein
MLSRIDLVFNHLLTHGDVIGCRELHFSEFDLEFWRVWSDVGWFQAGTASMWLHNLMDTNEALFRIAATGHH